LSFPRIRQLAEGIQSVVSPMKNIFILSVICAAIVLAGFGCANLNKKETGRISQVNVAPQTKMKFFVSPNGPESKLKYCNGAEMDSAGYKNSLTEEAQVHLSQKLSGIDLIKRTLDEAAAAEGFSPNLAADADYVKVVGDTAYLKPVDGWAGVSIFLCAWQPFVEKNLEQFSEIKKIEWTSPPDDSAQTNEQPQNNAQQLKKYINKQFGYSFEYPKTFTSIQEQNNSVTLAANESDHWAYDVSVSTSSFKSTQEWLDAQPKGSATSAGYEPVLQIGDDFILVSEYVVIDYNGKKPIYGKHLLVIAVRDGKLFKISISGNMQSEDTPFLSQDDMGIISSFQLN